MKKSILIGFLLVGLIAGSLVTNQARAFVFGSINQVNQWIKDGSIIKLRTETNNVRIGGGYGTLFINVTDGKVGIGTTTPNAKLDINVSTTTDTGIVVRGAVSQSANLQEWQDGGGTILSNVDASGDLSLPNKIDFSNADQNVNLDSVIASGIRNVNIGTSGTNTGSYNAIVGYGTSDAGYSQTVAFGPFASPSGDWSVSLGYGTHATADSISMGRAASNTGTRAVSIGRGSSSAFQSVAIGGISAVASGGGAVALGAFTTASNTNSFAMGTNAQSTASNAMAIGAESSATHSYSTAIGYQSTTNSANQLMIGTSTRKLNTYINGNGFFDIQSATDIGLTVRGASSQTANLQEWQDSAGNVLTTINSEGDFIQPTDTNESPIRIRNSDNSANSLGISFYDSAGTTNAYGIGMGPWSTEGTLNYYAGTADSVSMGHRFYVNNTKRMTLTGQGYLGLGVDPPDSMIHIEGSTPKIKVKDNRVGGEAMVLLAGTAGAAFATTNTGMFSIQLSAEGNFGNGSDYALNMYGSTKNALFGDIAYNTSDIGSQLGVISGSSSKIAYIVRGASSQTANLQEWQDSSGTVLSSVNASGQALLSGLFITSSSTPATSSSTCITGNIKWDSDYIYTCVDTDTWKRATLNTW